MHELVDLSVVERLFGLLAWLTPLLGIGIAAALWMWARRTADPDHPAIRNPRSAIRNRVVLIGLLGPANWLLWRIYNGIEDRFGLDSVKALLLNLAFFAALGVALGVGVRAFRRSGVF
jgi:hypothetical protein